MIDDDEQQTRLQVAQSDGMGSDSDLTPVIVANWDGEPGHKPWLVNIDSHASGQGFPMSEFQLQDMLNEDYTATYPLQSLPDMDVYKAFQVVQAEIDTNFPNALCHVREARQLYEHELLEKGDLQVIQHIRKQGPPEPPKKKEKKGGRLFGRKKPKSEDTPVTPEAEADAPKEKKGLFSRKKKKEEPAEERFSPRNRLEDSDEETAAKDVKDTKKDKKKFTLFSSRGRSSSNKSKEDSGGEPQQPEDEPALVHDASADELECTDDRDEGKKKRKGFTLFSRKPARTGSDEESRPISPKSPRRLKDDSADEQPEPKEKEPKDKKKKGLGGLFKKKKASNKDAGSDEERGDATPPPGDVPEVVDFEAGKEDPANDDAEEGQTKTKEKRKWFSPFGKGKNQGPETKRSSLGRGDHQELEAEEGGGAEEADPLEGTYENKMYFGTNKRPSHTVTVSRTNSGYTWLDGSGAQWSLTHEAECEDNAFVVRPVAVNEGGISPDSFVQATFQFNEEGRVTGVLGPFEEIYERVEQSTKKSWWRRDKKDKKDKTKTKTKDARTSLKDASDDSGEEPG
eukprot:NODE_483_length_1883_cov_40.409453_g476_i0.p1 GENE.NODE_483_length_1883_cov_40.409453_g476_i0~~NODE_483_length_1883_cov_40.409453_g476_i0.p1  ORF type:complete len:568 (-),score=139.29 NODE_483_length_1883_cov_40.409453_g476_i0:98-1801(-)